VQDIRVDDAFFGHPKTVRFYRRTGDHGIACLFRLWCYTSRYFPKGILTAMSHVEISDAAGWKNDPLEFISALLDAGGPGKAGFIDLCDSHYGLHNWRKRNPYAYFREERSEIARKAAEIGWEKRKKPFTKRAPNAKGKANSNAESNAKRNAPAPAPSPVPKPEKKICGLSTQGGNSGGADAPSGVLEAPAGAAPTGGNINLPTEIKNLNLRDDVAKKIAALFREYQAHPIHNNALADALLAAGLTSGEIVKTAQAFLGSVGKGL